MIRGSILLVIILCMCTGTNELTPKMIRAACVWADYNVNDIYEQYRFFYIPRLEKYRGSAIEFIAEACLK